MQLARQPGILLTAMDIKYTAILLFALSANANAWDYLEPIKTDSGTEYKSRLGNTYKYDLSRPSDQLKYQLDVGSQLRDQLDVDPRRTLERDLGQYGAGKINNR